MRLTLNMHLNLFSNSMDNSNIKGSKQPKLEKYFRHSIQMVLQDKMSWSTLSFLLVDMAQTVVDCKQLIKVLLKELEISYKEKQGVYDDLKTTEEDVYDYQEVYSENETQEITNHILPEINNSTETETVNAIGNDDAELINDPSEWESFQCVKALSR